MSCLPALTRRPASTSCAALALAVLLAGWSSLAASEPADPAPSPTSARAHPGWSEEALGLAEALPVQAGGRVKPLLTLAGYTLLALNGRKSVKVFEAGEERWIGPTEWLLDVLFFPDVAAHYRIFLVQDDATLDAIGFTREMRESTAAADYARDGGGASTRKKRDRWSFADLAPVLGELERQGSRIDEAKELGREPSRVEAQVLALSQNVVRYAQLMGSLALATGRLAVPKSPELERILGPASEATFTHVARHLEELLRLLPPPAPPGQEPPALTPEQEPVARLLQDLVDLGGGSGALALLPPVDGVAGAEPGAWLNPNAVLLAAQHAGQAPATSLGLLEAFERLGSVLERPDESLRALRTLSTDLVGAAEARGDYEHVALEVTYQRLDPVSLSWKIYFAGLAFALLGLLSLRGGRAGRSLRPLAWVLTGGAATVLVVGIVMRCIIRERPPVTTLYETILFITATGTLACFVIEALSRRWIALPVAGTIGTLGLLLAQWFEGLNKQDTMPTLEAVLDTNFWLSTHVTSITFGYSAGLLAALVGMVYVLGRVFGLGKEAHDTYAAIGRTVYGVICFGLLLSIVGTILGGIWANDSWGRFWGWDPKENGALMICLWELLMLHARLGGYVGPFGFSMLAVAGGAVVSWSWWGVNQLGVGLHSYGFTEGIQTMLTSIYLTLGGVLVLGLGWWFMKGPGSVRRA